MSRSILTLFLRRAFQTALKEISENKLDESWMNQKLSSKDKLDGSPLENSSRREFIQNSVMGLGLLTSWDNLKNLRSQNQKTDSLNIYSNGLLKKNKRPIITIIGAGIAGLNFSYQCKKSGFQTNIYESSNRYGGRMFTKKGIFGHDLTTDFGGEWVDENHEDIKTLCKEFNIDLYSTENSKLHKHTYYFDGKILSPEEIYQAIAPYVQILRKDIERLPSEITRENILDLKDLDSLSIAEYLERIKIKGWLKKFLIIAMESEYGASVQVQSALNLLVILHIPLSIQEVDTFEGQGAEIMKIKGGSENLCRAIYEQVKEDIHFDYTLVSIDVKGVGYQLNFDHQNTSKSVYTDYLVLTLPFSRLRNVKMNLPLSSIKKKSIEELSYGNSAKLIMGFSEKPWKSQGHLGKLTTELSVHTAWDSSIFQSEEEGSYTVFSGGALSEEIKNQEKEVMSEKILKDLEMVYPGVKKAYTGKVEKFIWETYPHNLGAYSYYRVGDWTRIGGYESEKVDRIYFAGEHCSMNFQGYMNGAAHSARVAAKEMLEDIQINFK